MKTSRILVLVFGVFAAFVLFSGLVAWWAVKRADDRKQQAAVVASLEDQLARFEDAVDADGMPQPIRDAAPSSGATGEFAVIEGFVRSYMDDLARINNEYLAELGTMRWETILDGNRMKADAGFVESRRMVEDARALAKKYEGLVRARIARVPADIAALDLPARTKREFESGFQTGQARSQDALDGIWRLEHAVLEDIAGIVELVAAQSQWDVQDGQIMFDNDEAVTKFNAYLAAVNEKVAEQERLRQQSLTGARERLQDLR